MTALDVIAGKAKWSAEQADALEWLRGLPDDSVDLLFTSPPYLEARTYGIGAGRNLDDWVAWMLEVVKAAAPKVKGLIAINCEGQTRNYRYLPAPFMLAAELYRAGFNLRRPAYFHRVGIPGSGGPDWLRCDIEPIICVTRKGRLPWSDNIAEGQSPRYAPGGAMSHRMRNGERVNGKMVFQVHSSDGYRDGDMVTKKTKYTPPEKANPGNVVFCDAGGGRMGHALAHESEAPFPLELPAFFVKSFCPPDGIVADCFLGSGTTIDAAFQHGRRGIGCDVRQSQVDLTERRMRTVTGPLFA